MKIITRQFAIVPASAKIEKGRTHEGQNRKKLGRLMPAEEPTTKELLVVHFEGKRKVSRKVKHYNLNMTISVGYHVNSKRGMKFRQWATSLLKEYLLRGSVRDQRISKLEKRMADVPTKR